MKNGTKIIIILIYLILSSLSLLSQGYKWTQIFPKDKPAPRCSFGMCDIDENRVILFGGYGYDGTVSEIFNDTWIFDIKTMNWERIECKNKPPIRYSIGMAKINNDKVILFGGINSYSFFNDTWIFDYKTKEWNEIFPKTIPRIKLNYTLSFLRDNNVLMYEGNTSDSIQFSIDNDTWLFNLDSLNWEKLIPMDSIHSPLNPINNRLVFVDTNKVMIFIGGRSFDPNINNTWLYDYTQNRWIEKYIHVMYKQVKETSLCNFERNKAIFFGGIIHDTTGSRLINETWILDLIDGFWRKLFISESPEPRHGHEIARIGKDSVLLFGGNSFAGPFFNDTWLLTPIETSVIEENETKSILSPNPASDFIEISVGTTGGSAGEIGVYDVFGRCLLKTSPPAPLHVERGVRIDISGLPPGLYFVRYKSGNQTGFEKFVVR